MCGWVEVGGVAGGELHFSFFLSKFDIHMHDIRQGVIIIYHRAELILKK